MSVTGIEVEGIEVPAAGLKKIVVGEVKENSIRIRITYRSARYRESELSQIVCGAPNIKSGIKVIAALPRFTDRGQCQNQERQDARQQSNGMICSLEELGYSYSVIPKEYAEGICYLPTDAEVEGRKSFPISIWMMPSSSCRSLQTGPMP